MQRIYPIMNSSTINHNEIEIHSLLMILILIHDSGRLKYEFSINHNIIAMHIE